MPVQMANSAGKASSKYEDTGHPRVLQILEYTRLVQSIKNGPLIVLAYGEQSMMDVVDEFSERGFHGIVAKYDW